jgi:hypothetical protein
VITRGVSFSPKSGGGSKNYTALTGASPCRTDCAESSTSYSSSRLPALGKSGTLKMNASTIADSRLSVRGDAGGKESPI